MQMHIQEAVNLIIVKASETDKSKSAAARRLLDEKNKANVSPFGENEKELFFNEIKTKLRCRKDTWM